MRRIECVKILQTVFLYTGAKRWTENMLKIPGKTGPGRHLENSIKVVLEANIFNQRKLYACDILRWTYIHVVGKI